MRFWPPWLSLRLSMANTTAVTETGPSRHALQDQERPGPGNRHVPPAGGERRTTTTDTWQDVPAHPLPHRLPQILLPATQHAPSVIGTVFPMTLSIPCLLAPSDRGCPSHSRHLHPSTAFRLFLLLLFLYYYYLSYFLFTNFLVWDGVQHFRKCLQFVFGVRQGGILSPLFFNVYMDGLSDILCRTETGCAIGGINKNE